MRTLFIADLHLSENQPKICDAFFAFLKNENREVEALYILGDLFEVWIGDDEHTPLMDKVALALADYATINNIKIYYIHGNRDFMIGKKYAKQSLMQLLPEHSEITLYGKNVLIMHGDTLCLADENYQKMRKIIHNPQLQFIFNLLPLFLRKKIGWKIRSASQNKKVDKNRDVMAVTESEVVRLMQQHNAEILIHGHTHQAAEHPFQLLNRSVSRFDVGDWFKDLSFVEATEDKTQLITRPVNYYKT